MRHCAHHFGLNLRREFGLGEELEQLHLERFYSMGDSRSGYCSSRRLIFLG
jgi:hypothetical protein